MPFYGYHLRGYYRCVLRSDAEMLGTEKDDM
jgi:hypothetical protein